MSIKNETAIVEIIIKGQQSNATLKDMEKAARALRAQLSRLPKDSQEFADKSKELQKINRSLQTIREDIKGTGGMFQWLSKEIKAFGIIAMAVFGFQWITGQVTNIIRGNAELSDSLADVRKTTGMTEAEAKKLNKTLSQMDTRTSTKELRQIAISAGQLGIAKKDVLSFVAATDKMVVALGDEFQGGAEEVTKVMGGLRNIFQDIKTDKIDQDMLRIGNSVNVLASTGAATGPVLTDFANRIGSVGISLGLSSAQVLGLSATLQELNVGTEKGGTATVKILQRMTTHVAEFAAVAKMDVKAFADLVNRDLFAAFQKVLEGAQKSGSSATALGSILDSLGVDGAGASEVMTKLGSNMKLLQDRVLTANNALQGTSSIMEEFRIKNDTLGAEMDRLGKNIGHTFTNSTVSRGLQSLIGWLADITDNTKKVSQSMREERSELMTTEAQILTYNVGNKDRTRLIKELQERYPEYLGNIDAETVSHEALSRAIAKVNDNLVNKIIIQQQDEKIAEHAEEQAKAAIKSGEARVKVLQDIANIYAQNQKNLFKGATTDLKKDLSGLPMEVQASEILKFENYTGAGLSRFNRDIISLMDNYAEWKEAELELNKQKIVGNELDNEKRKLLAALGINTQETTTEVKELSKAARAGYVDTKALAEAEKKLLEEHKKLLLDLKSLREENSMFGLADMEKEQDKVLRAAEEMRERILADEKMSKTERHNALIILEENTQRKLNEIALKYFEKAKTEQKRLQQEYNSFTNNERQNEIDAENAKFAELLEAYKNDLEMREQLEVAHQENLKKIEEKYKPKPADEANEEKKRIRENERKADEYFRLQNEIYQIGASIDELQRQKRQYESEDLDRKAEADIRREQRLLDQNLISQKQFDARVAKIENEREQRHKLERQREYAHDQKAAIFSAILNGAEAVTRIWAKHAANPIAAGLLTALAAGTTIAQIAVIKGTQPPKYGDGGMHTPGGYADKETLYASSTGQPFIAGERGREWIAPNWMLNDPIIANDINNLEAIRQKGRFYAVGGSTSTASGSAPTFSSSSNSSENGRLCFLIEECTRTLRELQRNGVPAYISYDSYNRSMGSIENARNSSRVG